MQISAETPLRELAIEVPGASRILEAHHLDYFCGGALTLAKACERAKLPLEPVLEELVEAQQATASIGSDRPWLSAPLAELIDAVVTVHHGFTRSELEHLVSLSAVVAGVHGRNHPELARVRELVGELAEEMSTHMEKEERVLFPYIAALELAQRQAHGAPHLPFGSVQNPIRVMSLDHDSAAEILAELRELTRGFVAPPEACTKFRTLYQRLEALEHDLIRHVHLENNILFPRAIALEAMLVGVRRMGG